jgi:peptidoglycan/LPS O-acetylase OafA/YrhL
MAVAAVLLYHLPWNPAGGGVLGVSAFFTLSGFLITSLLLDELEGTGTLRLREFWARRVRRLLPPIVVAIVLVVLFGRFAATAGQQEQLRWDGIATLTEWANWRFLLTGQEYGGQQFVQSPLLHTWSLSIEEQCYIVLPLLLLGAWYLAGRRGIAISLAVLTAGGVVAGLFSGAQTAYYGTHVRAVEVLVGALGALAMRSRFAPRLGRICVAVAPVALLAMVVSWTRASETSPALRQGGFLAHAIATLAVVVAVSELVPATKGTRLGRALSATPLVALGAISYGVYLYHWPLYQWLTPRRLGLEPLGAAIVRISATLALAVVSYHLLEQPVRRRRARSGRTLAHGGAVLASALGVVAVAVPLPSAAETITIRQGLQAPPRLSAPRPVTSPPSVPRTTPTTAGPMPIDPNESGDSIDSNGSTPAQPRSPAFAVWPPLVPPAPESLAEVPRIMLTGDSAAATIGNGLQRFGSGFGLAEVWVSGRFACPITEGGDIRWNDGVVFTIEEHCAWEPDRRRELADIRPDLVVVWSGLWEIADRRFPPSPDWTHAGRPDMDRRIEADFSHLVDFHRAAGTRVLLVLQPPVKNSIYAQLPGPLPEEDPERMERLNTILRGVAVSRPGVWTLDLPAVFEDRYDDEYALTNRVDGFHWTDEGADIDASWLVPLLVDIARQPNPPPAGGATTVLPAE